MCQDCGCGEVERFGVQPMQPHPGKRTRLVDGAGGAGHSHASADAHEHEHVHADGTIHSHPHSHEHGHEHGHDHGHDHVHSHGPSPVVGVGPAAARTVSVGEAILARNIRLAERNRGFLRAKGLTAINLLSSPGAGKTTLIEKTVGALREDRPAAVIVGDLATANDARRIHATGAPVVQITTGTVCHLDAEMVARGLEALDLEGRRLLFVENVGNLVCPADFDLGEQLRVVLVSVAEGEDKPLKYPPMFRSAQVVVITKLDLVPATGCDLTALRRHIHDVAPQARILELSSRTGEGFGAWLDYLRSVAPV